MSKPRKPRGSTRFPKREVTRITEAVRVAGGGKVTLDPETGHYTILVASEGGAPPDTTTTANPWDAVYAADSKRPA
jgi:hypothetical protein